MSKVYIRLKHKIVVDPNRLITIRDIATIRAPKQIKSKIGSLVLPSLKTNHETYEIIESFIVLDVLKKEFSSLDVQFFGSNETIVERMNKSKRPSYLFVFFVWIILFTGTAMTLVNFHYDVSMQEVQQQIHYLLTGDHVEQPLLLQIPYSFGLGVGMVLFLNHWFKKRINDEPSPLELELYKYKRDIDDYIVHHEKDVNDS